MKSKDLLIQIQENIKEYDIKYLEDKIKDKDLNSNIRQLSKYNIETYYEILKMENINDFEISDTIITNMKNELNLFFSEASSENEELFKKFITNICLYLSLIAKKPLHPVGMKFTKENAVFMEELNNGKINYYCTFKEKFKKEATDYYICKFCVCKSK